MLLLRSRRTAVVLVATALLTATATTPASARPDAGDGPVFSSPVTGSGDPGRCPLTRVGRHYVHCDALTGAGATAPAWIPVASLG